MDCFSYLDEPETVQTQDDEDSKPEGDSGGSKGAKNSTGAAKDLRGFADLKGSEQSSERTYVWGG